LVNDVGFDLTGFLRIFAGPACAGTGVIAHARRRRLAYALGLRAWNESLWRAGFILSSFHGGSGFKIGFGPPWPPLACLAMTSPLSARLQFGLSLMT